MIRVTIIDDEALVRSGFTMMLNAAEDIEVVSASDGVTAMDVIARDRPDVVLLDIRMPQRNGMDILTDIRRLDAPPVVAILTTFDSDDYIARALREGAAGFLVKDTDPEQLPLLIRSLAAGGIALSSKVSRTVIDGYLGAGDRTAARLLKTLTQREREVLARLSLGQSNTEIARRLHVSTGTVKDHVSAILAKFGVTTRLQAALVAERGGLNTRPMEHR
ncbi:response regulator [Sciscionella sediminilitoris]|uniref:response regulator n=1 Tax=Sciscionella sediminilitoris TaxID=1445613 RepID=UPI0004DEE666|nr:response regulator transcription factor [Sciscionella sp. SE31]